MDVDKEYIVVMVDMLQMESVEYFTARTKAIKYANEMKYAFESICVKEIDYKNKTEEIIWEV